MGTEVHSSVQNLQARHWLAVPPLRLLASHWQREPIAAKSAFLQDAQHGPAKASSGTSCLLDWAGWQGCGGGGQVQQIKCRKRRVGLIALKWQILRVSSEG